MIVDTGRDILERARVTGHEELKRDRQTVTTAGRPLIQLIEGVVERRLITHADERGSLCEILDPKWELDHDPLCYVYQASLLPGYVKGWVIHFEQADRLFLATGRLRIVLFDGREDSPTFRVINKFEGGDFSRVLVRIPAGVYHAVQNIGSSEAFYYNMPTKPYCHENPDKYRLPLDTDLIPYRFEDARGW